MSHSHSFHSQVLEIPKKCANFTRLVLRYDVVFIMLCSKNIAGQRRTFYVGLGCDIHITGLNSKTTENTH